MRLDRALQLELLSKLADAYPDMVNVQELQRQNPAVNSTLQYLMEHGLISGKSAGAIGRPNEFFLAKATAAGMDFLADDGGLSAILGVVTIKLHDDTIRQLIEARIQSAELPETAKSHLLKSLREAPGETIKLLTEKLLDAGLANLPAALPLIQRVLGGIL